MPIFDKVTIDGQSIDVRDTSTANKLSAEIIAREEADNQINQRINNLRFKNVYYPEDYGAVGDGSADDYSAIQQCVNAAASNGVVVFTSGKVYRSNSVVTLQSKSTLIGYGSTVLFPSSHGFQNLGFGDPPSTTNYDIHILGLTLDGGGTADGLIRWAGVHRGVIRDCYIHNVPVTGITTGLSIANGCTDIVVDSCTIDIADYAIILASEANTRAQGVLYNRNITISSCDITTDWGTGIAMQGGGRSISVSNCNIHVTGVTNNVGLGIKINEGVNGTYNVRYVTISGCNFDYGNTGSSDNAAVTIGNYNDYLTIDGCTFRNFYNAITPNYTNGALHLTVSCCICVGEDNSLSFINATASANVYLDLTGCQVYNVGQAIAGGAYDNTSIVGLVCRGCARLLSVTSSNMIQLVGCYIYNASQTAIMITNPVSGAVLTISGCNFSDCSPGNSVITLGSGNAIVSGTTISNQSGTKPTYAIRGGGVVCMTGCWLYGFSSGYYDLSGSSSVTTNNVERGGIG